MLNFVKVIIFQRQKWEYLEHEIVQRKLQKFSPPLLCNWSTKQCDQIERFFKAVTPNTLTKIAQIVCNFYGNFEIVILGKIENSLGEFCKNGLLLFQHLVTLALSKKFSKK